MGVLLLFRFFKTENQKALSEKADGSIHKKSRFYLRKNTIMISGRSEGGGVDGYVADLHHVCWNCICMY